MNNDYLGKPEKSAVLYKAVFNAGKLLGLSKSEVAVVLGINSESFIDEINPDSREGVCALYLVCIYRGLYAMCDANLGHMKLWMRGYNRGTEGIPCEQVKDNDGLIVVRQYIDTMLSKENRGI